MLVYWTDAGLHRICRHLLRGVGGSCDVVVSEVRHPYRVAVFKVRLDFILVVILSPYLTLKHRLFVQNIIYWSDWQERAILRKELVEGAPQQFVVRSDDGSQMMDVKIFFPQLQAAAVNSSCNSVSRLWKISCCFCAQLLLTCLFNHSAIVVTVASPEKQRRWMCT